MDRISVNLKSFQIIKLLGKGKGGYSYLVTDGSHEYVVKKIHHEPCDYYNFGNKIESEKNDYQRLLATGISIPKMLDIDEHNETILKEYIDGPTAYSLVKEDRLPADAIDQLKQMSSKVYSAGLNIDYFPTNFVLQDGKFFYIDFECNNYMEEWNFENWGIEYWSKTEKFNEYVNSHPDL
ncbi:MAG: hypothetical protein ACI4UM_07505 [Succinivibrio sp.]